MKFGGKKKTDDDDDEDKKKNDDEDKESVASSIGRLSQEWIPFFDAKGIMFYYNFGTGERMRRSPRGSALPSGANTPDDDDADKAGLKMMDMSDADADAQLQMMMAAEDGGDGSP